MAKCVFLLKTEKYRNFIGCLDVSVKIDKMSDFEIFALFCDNLSNVFLTEFFAEFFSLLCEELSENITPACLIGRENQKAIWRKLYGDTETLLKIESLEFVRSAPKEIKLPKKTDLMQASRFRELDLFIDSISEDIFLDTSNFEYLRPDKYHAKLTYIKISKGEGCLNSELSALLLWVLSSALMKRGRSVFLAYSGNIAAIKAIVDYLEQRKLTAPIYICVKDIDKAEALEISELCLLSKRKNISSVILDSEECDCIDTFCEKLPLSRIFTSKTQQK